MRELMRLHADVLFTFDDRGRMVASNEPFVPARRPAPRLFVGETATERVIRIGATVPDALAALDPRALAAALAPTEVSRGRCYWFAERVTTPPNVVALGPADTALVRDTYPWLVTEVADWQPCFAAVVDGAAVAVCFSARISSAAAEAGVDTLAAHRGRGHATAVALAWAAAIQASGRIAMYSTSADNLTSQAVARRCNLLEYGTETSWA